MIIFSDGVEIMMNPEIKETHKNKYEKNYNKRNIKEYKFFCIKI